MGFRQQKNGIMIWFNRFYQQTRGDVYTYIYIYTPCFSSTVKFRCFQVRTLICTQRRITFLIRGRKWSEKTVDKPWTNRRQTVERTFISVERTFISVERTTINFRRTQVAKNA